MISRMMGVLSARRNSLQEKEKGFTLIELLVVIVIIGILAAIAVPVYLNVQGNAKNSAVKSDLTNAKTALISVQTTTGTLPASAINISTVVTPADGYSRSANTSLITYLLTITAGVPSFCIAARSITDEVFFVTDTTGVAKVTATLPTNCTAPAALPIPAL